MGLRYKKQSLADCFFVTTTFRDKKPLGLINGVFEELAKAIQFQINETSSHLAAYVFMPSHIHFIIFIDGGKLSEFMRDFKKYTAQKSLHDICGPGGTWQERYDRQAIVSPDVMNIKINYIHFNPVKAELVACPQDWKWSSAGDYLDERKGPLEVWKEWM